MIRINVINCYEVLGAGHKYYDIWTYWIDVYKRQIITKADKSQATVIIDKADYIDVYKRQEQELRNTGKRGEM